MESKVTDSRYASEMNAVRRRRECLECGNRFTTFETVDLSLQVLKRDGRYEDFHIDKLIRGISSASRHTRISHDEVRALASKISAELMERQVRSIKSMELGEIVMKHLQALDSIAYIRFACVYKRFKDIDELVTAIEKSCPLKGEVSLKDKEEISQENEPVNAEHLETPVVSSSEE